MERHQVKKLMNIKGRDMTYREVSKGAAHFMTGVFGVALITPAVTGLHR